jgi:hypothetical protein
MYFGENPNKIKNVVSKQMKNFNLLYGGLIQGLPMVNFVANGKLQVKNFSNNNNFLILKFYLK